MSSQRFASLAVLGLLLAAGDARAQSGPPTPLPSGPAPGVAPGMAPGGYPPPGVYPGAPAPPGWYPAPQPMYPYTPMKRRSSGMIAGGVLLISLSSIGLIAGSAMVSAGDSGGAFTCTEFGCSRPGDSTLKGGGVAAIVIGLVALGVGIPLLVVGSQKVPDRDEARLPAVRLAAGSHGLALEF